MYTKCNLARPKIFQCHGLLVPWVFLFFIFAAFSATSGSKDRGRTGRAERKWMLCMTDSTATSRARNEAGQADFHIPNRRIIAKRLVVSEIQTILQKLAPNSVFP